MNYYVACKVPNGLRIGGTVLRAPYRWLPGEPYDPPPYMKAGFAITEVPAHDWEPWRQANYDSDLVRNGLIFGARRKQDVDAFCLAHRSAGKQEGLPAFDSTVSQTGKGAQKGQFG